MIEQSIYTVEERFKFTQGDSRTLQKLFNTINKQTSVQINNYMQISVHILCTKVA